jgi:hypothetical protein
VTAVDDFLATSRHRLVEEVPGTYRTIKPTSDQWRRHIYTDDLPGAEPVTLIGLSSQIKPIKANFEDYAAKTCAQWAVENVDTWRYLEVEEAVGLIAHERTRKLGRDADRGSSIHAVIEQIAAGESIWIGNPDAAPYLAAVKAFIADCDPEFILGEVACFNRTHHYAGTFDVLLRLRAYPELGLRLGDWKSRKAKDDLDRQHKPYLENAAQVAGYANAEYYVLDGERHPMPTVDGGLVVTLGPDGTYGLHPVDIEQAWPLCEAAVRCYQVEKLTRPFADSIIGGAKDGAGAHETSTATLLEAPAPAPAEATVLDLMAQLDASVTAAKGSRDAQAPAPTPDDVPPGLTPEWIAGQSAAIRARLAAVVNAAGGIPAGFTWPEQVRKFPDGGPQSWAGLVLANRFVCALEAECGMPFVEVLQPPVVEDRRPAPDLVAPAPAAAPAGVSEALADLDARVKVLPGDLRGAVNAHLATLGFGTDPRRWNDDQVALVGVELEEFEQQFTERVAALYAACDGHDDQTIAACVDLVCPPTQVGTWPVESLTAKQATHLQALLAAVTAEIVAVVDGEVRPTPGADRLLVGIYGGVGSWKAQFVTDMKALADRHGLPKPASSAKAAGDPLLVAVLAASHQQQQQGAHA